MLAVGWYPWSSGAPSLAHRRALLPEDVRHRVVCQVVQEEGAHPRRDYDLRYMRCDDVLYT